MDTAVPPDSLFEVARWLPPADLRRFGGCSRACRLAARRAFAGREYGEKLCESLLQRLSGYNYMAGSQYPAEDPIWELAANCPRFSPCHFYVPLGELRPGEIISLLVRRNIGADVQALEPKMLARLGYALALLVLDSAADALESEARFLLEWCAYFRRAGRAPNYLALARLYSPSGAKAFLTGVATAAGWVLPRDGIEFPSEPLQFQDLFANAESFAVGLDMLARPELRAIFSTLFYSGPARAEGRRPPRASPGSARIERGSPPYRE